MTFLNKLALGCLITGKASGHIGIIIGFNSDLHPYGGLMIGSAMFLIFSCVGICIYQMYPGRFAQRERPLL